MRGQQGEKFTYKLRVHPPRPDFNILFNPAAVTVPKDGAMVASLECERREGHASPGAGGSYPLSGGHGV